MEHVYHVCPNCGRRLKCDQPRRVAEPLRTNDVRVFENSGAAWLGGPRQLRLVMPDAVTMFLEPIFKSAATSILAMMFLPGVVFGVSHSWELTLFSFPVTFAVSFSLALVNFAKFYTYAPPEPEPDAEPEPEPEPPEDKRAFVGWESEARTKTTMRLEWYVPPVAVSEARSFALAVVNNGFSWVDERGLKRHNASISGPNYRKLRRDWLERGWCAEVGKATVVRNRHMVRRIALEQPG